MSANKTPRLALQVRYKSRAGTTTLNAVPQGGMVRVGNESFQVTANSLYFDGKRPTIDVVAGQAVAQAVWGAKEPLGPEEVDGIANNNIIQQIMAASKAGQSKASSWLILGAVGIAILVVVGFGIKTSNDMKDLRADFNSKLIEPGPTQGDTTTIQKRPERGQRRLGFRPACVGSGPPG